MAERGNITYVRALTMIAIFILLIACFNFVNLATAKSLQRAKEVGVRKTIGAGKKQLDFPVYWGNHFPRDDQYFYFCGFHCFIISLAESFYRETNTGITFCKSDS